MADNQEFVDTTLKQWEDGKTFHYVGVQERDGTPAIPFIREDGSEYIIFKMK